MELSLTMFLIVCPLVFLGGVVDAIGGGGGIITLPAYIFAGLPTHLAIGTNKLSALFGTSVATARFVKERLIALKLAIPTAICAVGGSFIGARLSINANEAILRFMMIPVLLIAAFFVMNKKLFGRSGSGTDRITAHAVAVGCIAAFVIGMYDGFYGPGTGTFLIIALSVFAHLSGKTANAHAKVINLTTNVTSFVVFMHGGVILWPLGLAAAVCNMVGGYIGSSLAVKHGDRIIRPIIITMLALLAIKIFIIG